MNVGRLSAEAALVKLILDQRLASFALWLRGERHRDDLPQQFVECVNFLLQQEVLLLCVFLPLLGDLQSLHQLRVLRVQILQQQAGL